MFRQTTTSTVPVSSSRATKAVPAAVPGFWRVRVMTSPAAGAGRPWLKGDSGVLPAVEFVGG